MKEVGTYEVAHAATAAATAAAYMSSLASTAAQHCSSTHQQQRWQQRQRLLVLTMHLMIVTECADKLHLATQHAWPAIMMVLAMMLMTLQTCQCL